MSKKNEVFDISMLLMTLFSSMESICDENDIELIFDVEPTVPKELKGDSEALLHLLTQVLAYVLQNTEKREIVLSLSAPEDFFYEEVVTFTVEETGINEVKRASFIENRLSESLEPLNAVIEKSEADSSDIVIGMPLKVDDIGNRRHYRLPDISMLGKKVLLLCDKKKVAASIRKMFRYFLYEVDVGLEAYKTHGNNLAHYDILVIAADLTSKKLEDLIARIQKEHALKYVVIESAKFNVAEIGQPRVQTAYLIKPAMQESVYELIIDLYKKDVEERKIPAPAVETIIDMRKYIDFKRLFDAEENTVKAGQTFEKEKTKEKPEVHNMPPLPILDTELGERNARTVMMDYRQKLQAFWDDFKLSDRFFRDIVHDGSVWKAKEFLTDVEKKARFIGAARLIAVVEKASMLFVYDKTDELPLYVNKYHVELQKLSTEIDRYLHP